MRPSSTINVAEIVSTGRSRFEDFPQRGGGGGRTEFSPQSIGNKQHNTQHTSMSFQHSIDTLLLVPSYYTETKYINVNCYLVTCMLW